MSLKSIANGLESLESQLKGAAERAGEQSPAGKDLEKFAEGITTIAKLVDSLTAASFWEFFDKILEYVEEALNVLAKIAGGNLELPLKLLAKFVTQGSKALEMLRELEDSVSSPRELPS